MSEVPTRPARTPGRPAPRGGTGLLTALDGVVVTSAGVEAFDCPLCGQVRDLVVPTCEDEHADCPDRACAVCGFAVAVGHVDSGGSATGRAPGARVSA